MNFFDRLNSKSKAEQVFILLLLFVAGLSLFGLTGCFGGKSCELPSYNSFDYGDVSAISLSIPGCGGCLTSGRGCNMACWPQSCKFVGLSADEGEEGSFSVTGCDIRYYDGGCLGCAQSEKFCYSGCIDYTDNSFDRTGFFYGSSDSEEKLIGYSNGCVGCAASGNAGREMMDMAEGMAELGDLQGLVDSYDWLNNLGDDSISDESETEEAVTKEKSAEQAEEAAKSEKYEGYEEYEEPIEVEEDGVMECYHLGRINTHGGTVAGFKTSYVVDGGKVARVRKSLGNGWHIEAVRCCYTKNIWWYELYDSQDGDYYGWVDSNYIDFDD